MRDWGESGTIKTLSRSWSIVHLDGIYWEEPTVVFGAPTVVRMRNMQRGDGAGKNKCRDGRWCFEAFLQGKASYSSGDASKIDDSCRQKSASVDFLVMRRGVHYLTQKLTVPVQAGLYRASGSSFKVRRTRSLRYRPVTVILHLSAWTPQALK